MHRMHLGLWRTGWLSGEVQGVVREQDKELIAQLGWDWGWAWEGRVEWLLCGLGYVEMGGPKM